MPADNSRHLTAAARARARETRRKATTAIRELTTTTTPFTVASVAQHAGVSRSWIYTQADLLQQIRDHQPTPATSTPRHEAASDNSLRQRLHLAHDRIQQLEADNRQLRHALAQTLGDQRARHARAEPKNHDTL